MWKQAGNHDRRYPRHQLHRLEHSCWVGVYTPTGEVVLAPLDCAVADLLLHGPCPGNRLGRLLFVSQLGGRPLWYFVTSVVAPMMFNARSSIAAGRLLTQPSFRTLGN